MRIAVDYWELSQAISNTSHLATELDEYCDDLSRKVQKKMYEVTGGMSQALHAADYYVSQKINSLRAKSANAVELSQKLSKLLDTARRVDGEVKAAIESNQKDFFEKRPDLRPSDAQLFIMEFFCGMKDVPVLGWLIKTGEKVDQSVADVIKEIRYWYKCEGGKEQVGFALSIAETIAAAVLLVLAVVTPTGLIAGIAATVAALIGLFDAITNTVTSYLAHTSAEAGHPGQAKTYSEQNKLSEVLRDTNFHDAQKNRKSNEMAAGLDITESVCDLVGITGNIKNTVDSLKELNLKQILRTFGKPRNPDGTFAPGKPSIWNGAKSLVSNMNAKDMLLGDLNVRNLSRLDQYKDLASKLKNYESLTKSLAGITGDLDKMNEGDMTLAEFVGKRLLMGADKSILKEEVLITREVNGQTVRVYDRTNLSKVIEALRSPIDDLGMAKLIGDSIGNNSFENVVSFKDGIIQKGKDILDAAEFI